MIEAIIVYGNEEINKVNNIREQIYEKNCCTDNLDEAAYHVIVFEKNEPIATGRLLTQDNYVVDKVCVIKDKRKKYFGDLVVKMLLDKAFKIGAIEVFAYVPTSIIGFFEKIGFCISEEINTLNKDMNKMKINKAAVKKCSH